MFKLLRLYLPILENPHFGKVDPELWLTQAVIDTGWLLIKRTSAEDYVRVVSAYKKDDDWLIGDDCGNSYHTTYSSLADQLVLELYTEMAQVLCSEVKKVKIFKAYNPFYLWMLFGQQKWVYTRTPTGWGRVTALTQTLHGFKVAYLEGGESKTISHAKLQPLKESLALLVPSAISSIFSFEDSYFYLTKVED